MKILLSVLLSSVLSFGAVFAGMPVRSVSVSAAEIETGKNAFDDTDVNEDISAVLLSELIAEVGEDYSSEKLRGLLREANDVIREQLTLLHTLVGNQSKGDALSFLEENSSSEEDKAMEEDTLQIESSVCCNKKRA